MCIRDRNQLILVNSTEETVLTHAWDLVTKLYTRKHMTCSKYSPMTSYWARWCYGFGFGSPWHGCGLSSETHGLFVYGLGRCFGSAMHSSCYNFTFIMTQLLAEALLFSMQNISFYILMLYVYCLFCEMANGSVAIQGLGLGGLVNITNWAIFSLWQFTANNVYISLLYFQSTCHWYAVFILPSAKRCYLLTMPIRAW